MKITIYPLHKTILNQDTFIDVNSQLNHNDVAILPQNFLKCDKNTANKIYDLLHQYELEMTIIYDKYPNTEIMMKDGYTMIKKIRKSIDRNK